MDSEALSAQSIESEPVPEPADQKREVQELLDMEGPMEEGDEYCIISLVWYNQWRDYVGMERPPLPNDSKEGPSQPGPIDNTPILDPDEDDEVVEANMQESRDFDFISRNVWDQLHLWYGGGPLLSRRVIKVGNELKVEVHHLKLLFVQSSDDETDDATVGYFSKADSVNTMHRRVCHELDKPLEDVRLWDFYQDFRQKILNVPDISLEDAQILDEQKILVEVKKNGAFSEVKTKVSSAPVISYPTTYNTGYNYYGSSNYSSNAGYSSYSSGYGYSSYSARSYNYPPADKPGLVGLSNLGNTCFMNSSIQCLANTVPLATEFISDHYQNDLNPDNPLGTGGQLAKEWAKLMKDIWSGKTSVVAPRDFKWRLGKFAPQFEGYQQHDSQELLSFLLDGLHEDLNRVKKKPFVETSDSDGRPDEEVANEHWAGYRARNDSVIVDWFQGQFKSTLECPTCDRISVTFDPFMYLSLPIPMSRFKILPVTVVFLDPARQPLKCSFKLGKQASAKELYQEIGKYFELPPAFVSCDLFASKFYKRFAPDWGIVDNFQAGRDAIYVYQVAPTPEPDQPRLTNMAVYMRRLEAGPYSFTRTTLFGNPFWHPVTENITPEKLYAELVHRLARFLDPEPEPEPQAEEDKIPLTSSGAELSQSKDSLAESKDSVGSKGATGGGEEASSSDDSERLDSSSSSSSDDAPPSNQFKGKLFNILFCDPYGNALTRQPFLEIGQPVQVPPGSTILLDWTAEGLSRYKPEIEKEVGTDPSSTLKDEDEESSCSIERCIRLFTEKETLGEDDLWYCNRCKDHKQADKKFDLWSLPKILVIHLKRFSYKGKYMFREKLDTIVETPLKGLDLRPFLLKPDEGAVYDLYAVSNHYGALGGGHYTASAVNRVTGQWYKFDDSSVSPLSEEHVITSAAYVLFYRRRDSVDPAGLDAPDVLPLIAAEPEPEPQTQVNTNRNLLSSSSSSSDSDEYAVPITRTSGPTNSRPVAAVQLPESSTSDDDADDSFE